ncbi:hypothetical protein RN001_005459 [Aquatica leii]|uniref:F-box domain-containing protein n=1 Tax=Aquatica leii TaxID=1421715 RepID=A0AAN7Q721_9COLE|nr:hypothetical protein RN001_005459 [Aquatica leii]
MYSLIDYSFSTLLFLPVEMLVNILRFLDDKSLLNAAFSSKRFMRICKEDPLLRRRIRSYIRKEKQLIKQSTVNAKLQLEIIRHDQPQLFGRNQNKIVTVKKLNCLRFSSTAQPIAKHFAVSEPDNRPSGGGKLRTKCKDRLVPYKNDDSTHDDTSEDDVKVARDREEKTKDAGGQSSDEKATEHKPRARCISKRCEDYVMNVRGQLKPPPTFASTRKEQDRRLLAKQRPLMKHAMLTQPSKAPQTCGE